MVEDRRGETGETGNLESWKVQGRVCVFIMVACWLPSKPFPYGKSSELILTNLQVGLRPHHTLHTGTVRPQSFELYPIPIGYKMNRGYTLKSLPHYKSSDNLMNIRTITLWTKKKLECR